METICHNSRGQEVQDLMAGDPMSVEGLLSA
jgi:hypothetical protein